MGEVFFTSDFHFNHNREFIYKPRGFDNMYDMAGIIIKNCNEVISYNDDFYIPEFDSLDAAIRICNAYEVAGYEAEAVKCEDEGLKKAVEPAVRIIFEDNS